MALEKDHEQGIINEGSAIPEYAPFLSFLPFPLVNINIWRNKAKQA